MQSTTLLYSLLAWSFCNCIAVSSDATSSNEEKLVLFSIKSGIVDPLDALGNWGSSPSHCSWTGVWCSSAGLLTGIDISNMNLSGAMPPSLPNLLSLEFLDVSSNALAGEFPSGLGACARLKSVNGSGNDFSGSLPGDLANATSLQVLDLRGSFFEGPIPAAYGGLKSLKFLGLSGNNLTGEIPPELGGMSSLERLIMGYNGFEGSVPAELGNLTKLNYLDIAVGNLRGTIPPELGRLPSLTTLFLYKNNLAGEIPKEIGNISSLVLLDVSDNQISGEIPPELADLAELQLLNLMSNRLTGEVPAGIGGLARLEVLELWNNSLTGALPADLGRNSNLQWLDVSSNSLSGGIPEGLCDGGNLTKLILFNNRFSGEIPAGLSECYSLVRVRMQRNRLAGAVPSGLGKLRKLQRLELASNNLTGEIPADIAASTSLSFIDLSDNSLQLPLPSNILSIPTLQTFLASHNQLTGEILFQFQDCPALAALDLSHNRLTGGVPASLASCGRMVNLDLSSNGFTGGIPPAIARMPALAILDLSNNALTGELPDNFGSSPALEALNLSYNNLSGAVPANGMLRAINPSELAGNPGLCGGVLRPCGGADAPPRRRSAARIKRVAAWWAIVMAAVVGIALALLASTHLYRRWRYGSELDHCGSWPWRLTAFQRLSFTSAELVACVKESNVVGMGATGIVYKAELQRGSAVLAVKKLWRASENQSISNSASLETDLSGEVSVLGRLRHRNIVRLIGYLHNDIDRLIVYEYMPNGSLWEALHGPPEQRVLRDWVARYNVAAGVAAGMAYLHHDCHPPVIHRDVKSNNILLDSNLEARIADFGLARMMLSKVETVSMVAGSYGYIAPEYAYTLKVDQKSDIYSFGVVLMELVTGRRPVEPEYGECQDIVGWVREELRSSRGIEGVLDASIGGQCKPVQEEMLLVLRIAVVCTAKLPKDRPSMRDVVTMLGEAKPRRKSSSGGGVGSNVVEKDRPVFSTSPESDFV